MKLFKQILKRLFLIIVLFTGIIVASFLAIAITFFYNPTYFITPKNVNWALEQTHFLKTWSWKSAVINHEWAAWNKRRLSGRFTDLCLQYDNLDVNIETCMEKVSWDVELGWSLQDGFKYLITKPLVVDSSKLIVHSKDNAETTPPPDLVAYWDILWSKMIPSLNVNFRNINIISKKKFNSFDLNLTKDSEVLNAEALGFSLQATKNSISIFAPKKVLLPFDLKTKTPLYFSEIKFEAKIQENDIPITLTAKIETATLQIKSRVLKSSLKEDLTAPHFLRKIILDTSGSVEVLKLRSTIYELGRPPFNILPAPFNVMEGSIKFFLTTGNYSDNNSVLLKVQTELDMAGPKQVLKLALNSEIPFKLTDKTIGAVKAGVELKKVNILLPKLSRTKLPPQLIPDSRFKNTVKVVYENNNLKAVLPKEKKVPAKKVEVSMRLTAEGENSMQINTNLLDSPLKLNFDLEVADGEVAKGYIHALPFTTTIFKRKIIFESVRIIFNAPLEPEIIAVVKFDLPEYLITLALEGPLSKPRQAFSSEPALSLDDIYAVILFGRPLEGLDPDDKATAKKSNQILSQGILSLAVLYYFAGSPVESLGYDPETNDLSASIGLGSKNSLRVGGSGAGLNSAGIRRSLGKGWYIDSSIQKSTTAAGTTSGDYGVLLERIISY